MKNRILLTLILLLILVILTFSSNFILLKTENHNLFNPEILNNKPSVIDSLKIKTFNSLIEKGDSELLNGNRINALTLYKQANKLIPDHVLVYWRMNMLDYFKKDDVSSFWRLIEVADEMMDYNFYKSAKIAYLLASRVKPEDSYPLERVKQMEQLLKDKPLPNKVFTKQIDSLNEIYKKLRSIYHKKDSFLIADVKNFIFNEFGKELCKSMYTRFDLKNRPNMLVYVSLHDKIMIPPETNNFKKIGHTGIYIWNVDTAEKKIKVFNSMGYHAFLYKTYGFIGGELTSRFLSYQIEAISCILLHELTHCYVADYLKISYEFNEALADVVGNYGTLEYSRKTGNIDTSQAKKQLEINEKIYEYINHYIKLINDNPGKVKKLNAQCQRKLKPLIKMGSLFQKDRFDYKVNNAYLLKNWNYSKYYFLVKKVYLKQGSISKLLEIMRSTPKNSDEIEIYLQKHL